MTPETAARRRRRRPALLWIVLLPMGMLLAWLASLAPQTVEAAYSRGLYPLIAAAMNLVSGWLPFSLAEVVVGVFLLWAVWRLVRAARVGVRQLRGREPFSARALLLGMGRMLSLAAVVYLVFLAVWGLNYHRAPFASIAGLDTSPADAAELEALCERLIEQTNALRELVAEDEAGVMRLEDDQRDAIARSELGYAPATMVYPQLGGSFAPPKPVYFSSVLSIIGISGIYFPFTSEANINTTMPDSMLPFTTCHEMAHQRGFAREDEANYIGYLACRLHTDADFRYSGHLTASLYCLRAIRDERIRGNLRRRFSDGVVRDLDARRRWRERYRTPVARISKNINNAYLQANWQDDGVRSYGRMVDLLIAESRAMQ